MSSRASASSEHAKSTPAGGLGPDTLAGRHWMEPYIKEYQRYEYAERCSAVSGE